VKVEVEVEVENKGAKEDLINALQQGEDEIGSDDLA
jgi:hypothetical protein